MGADLKFFGEMWAEAGARLEELAEEVVTAEGAEGWLGHWSDVHRVVSEAGDWAARRASEDTSDADAEAAHLEYMEAVAPLAAVAEQKLKEKLLGVAGYEPSAEACHLVKRLRSEADLFRAENVPLNAQIDSLAADYDKIVGAMTVRDGVGAEELTLQQAERALQDTDRGVREAAWRAVQGRWLEDRGRLDELFLKLRGMRQEVAANGGYANYRDYRWAELQRFDYSPADGARFAEAIEKSFTPLALERREKRRRQLGVDSLRPWDLQVDAQSRAALSPFQSPAELEGTVARMLERLDPELGANFGKLRGGFLDLESRRNKAPGGYCAFFAKTGLPYIFMNAVGTHSDVQTLLHEAGHSFHDLESNAAQPLVWNVGAPAEFAEVASMGMELLAGRFLEAAEGGFYSSAEAQRARTEHLESVIQFMPYMAVVDMFQNWVYAEAGDGVTAAELDAHWSGLWERFLPGEDWSGLEDELMTGWHRKLHIYMAPFYYIEYGIAQLGALQVWRNSLADPAGALRKYREALALGNTRSLPKLFAAAGARFAFDSETVGELAALVREHLPE